MKHTPLPIFLTLIATTFLIALESFAEVASHDHSHDHDHSHGEAKTPSRVHSLEITVRPQRNGFVEVEQKFRLEVDGVSIKRGPALNYMTVFASDGGLILDTAMEVIEVSRNGKPEPSRLSTSNGTTTLLLGSEDKFLEPGPHEYLVRYRRLGSWKRQSNELTDSFDVTEAFRPFSIERLTASLVLPEGTDFTRRSAAVTGTIADGPGYRTDSGDGILSVETTAPLAPNHSVFLNTAWYSEGFSTKNKWMQLILQHPRIPIAAIGFAVLSLALWILIAGGIRRAKERHLVEAVS